MTGFSHGGLRKTRSFVATRVNVTVDGREHDTIRL